MRKFLLHSCILAFLVIIPIYAITFFADKGLQKSNDSYYRSWNDIIAGKINADVLVMGNSHARVQVDPFILDSVLHTNSYNLGLDAYPFEMQFTRYKMYCEHNAKPKLVILVIDYFTFVPTTVLFDKFQFIPYLGNPVLNKEVTSLGMPGYYHYLPFLKYYEFNNVAVSGLKEYFGVYHEPLAVYKGFWGRDLDFDQQQLDNLKKNKTTFKPELSPASVSEFEYFLDICKKDNVKVLIVLPPAYYEFNQLVTNRELYVEIIKKIAYKNKISFFDDTNDSVKCCKKYYYNCTHLNRVGAKLFSNTLAKQLQH